MTEDENKLFMQGFACCLVVLGVRHDMPTQAKDIAQSCGYSLASFEGVGLDKLDWKGIRAIFLGRKNA